MNTNSIYNMTITSKDSTYGVNYIINSRSCEYESFIEMLIINLANYNCTYDSNSVKSTDDGILETYLFTYNCNNSTKQIILNINIIGHKEAVMNKLNPLWIPINIKLDTYTTDNYYKAAEFIINAVKDNLYLPV